MHIVIDGYNLYKYIQHFKKISRLEFIKLLGKYASSKKHVITVVFDGGETSWPSIQKIGSVVVIEAGWQQIADEYIVQMIEKNSMSILLVVSSDQELCRQIDRTVVIDSSLFWNCVYAEIQSHITSNNEKTHPISKKPKKEWTDFDRYMYQAVFSQEIDQKEEQSRYEEIKHGKESRIDKRLMEVLKKL